MLIKKPDEIKSSEITDENLFWNRRTFIRGVALATTATATGLLYRKLATPDLQAPKPDIALADPAGAYVGPSGEQATPFEDIANYNNFYEFDTSKSGVAPKAKNFVTRPWTVEVGGMVHKPQTFDIDNLLKLASLEDRVYRFRCVEAWSMIIPWLGFPLKRLLDEVEPMGSAKYVAFTTLFDPQRMPNQRRSVLPWPYVEGLRLDEAMHPLTILAPGCTAKRCRLRMARRFVWWCLGNTDSKALSQSSGSCSPTSSRAPPGTRRLPMNTASIQTSILRCLIRDGARRQNVASANGGGATH